MSEVGLFENIEVNCEIVCVGCGKSEESIDIDPGIFLDEIQKKGWVADDEWDPYCPDCAKGKELKQ